MAPPIKRKSDWQSQNFSMIIDVRSDSEYADDHIPGAVSMPVLNDAERAELGTTRKRCRNADVDHQRPASRVLPPPCASSPLVAVLRALAAGLIH